MALSKETIDKLRAVQVAIRAEPKLYRQSRAAMPDPSCGTPGCLLGHAFGIYASKDQVREYRSCGDSITGKIKILTEGGEILGLNINQRGRLFSGAFGADHQNPGDAARDRLDCLFNRYTDASNDGAFALAAEIACERIDHFIATGGDE